MRSPLHDSPEYQQRWRLVRNSILFTAFLALLLWTAYLVRDVLVLVYISALLAIGMTPIVRVIERGSPLPLARLRPPRWLAILTIYLVVIGLAVSLAILIAPPLVRQTADFVRALPSLLDQVLEYAKRAGLVQSRLRIQDLIASASPEAAGAAPRVLSAILGFIGGVFGLVTILVLTFYLLLDYELLFHAFLQLFPAQHRAQLHDIGGKIAVKVSAWMTGQLLLGLSVGVAAAAGLGLMRVRYFIVLGVIAGVTELIPIIGPILGAVPAVLVGLAASPAKALLVAAFFFVIQQLEGHILVPKVMQRRVGIDPVAVLVALLIGGKLAGIVGAILAVPTAAILLVLTQEYLGAREAR